jgi:hypothetical protein
MRSDGQITADTKQKSNITNSVSRYSPWNHKTIYHTIKTALPISLPGVKKLLHNINTHRYCAPKTIKLFDFPIFRFWATWWRLFQKRSCALNLIFTFLLPLFSNIAIRMFSLKTRYTHCLIWYIQNVCKISR